MKNISSQTATNTTAMQNLIWTKKKKIKIKKKTLIEHHCAIIETHINNELKKSPKTDAKWF